VAWLRSDWAAAGSSSSRGLDGCPRLVRAKALQLIADGRVKVEPLLTHNLPLQAYPDAVEALRRGDGLKIQLTLALPDSRSDSSDVRGQAPTDGLVTEPGKPGQSRQQCIPYAQGRDSFDATQALQHRRRLLHAPSERAPALVVRHQGIHHRCSAGEFLG